MYVNRPFIRAEREVEAQAGKTMVKLLEIGGQLDVEEDDDCCEIDLAEFAKKVNLKAADDDVVVVAAKGPVGSSDSVPSFRSSYRFDACLAG
jgi:hypothetical protein